MAVVRLCRPEVRNAMNGELIDALADAVERLACDDGARSVIITGGDGAFSAGGDLRLIAHYRGGPAVGVRELAGKLHQAVIGIRRMPKPVIAAVSGAAAGAGMSLALACDLRVMARSARFVLAYTSRGLSVDGGASFSLPRLVGLARALEIAALDEPISAERALAWGLATRVVDDEHVFDAALALARQLAGRSVHAFGTTKRLLVDSFGRTLEAQLDLEQEMLERCAAHADGAEGLAAFGEKREPAFRRRSPAARKGRRAGGGR
ncbi:MAG: enoyl-CoA hydratase/isomerase family protein [Candidatus Binatia bacterium]